MDQIAMAALAVVLGATLALLAWQAARAGRARRAARAAYLDLCGRVFTAHVTKIAATGLPRVSGDFGEHVFDIQVAADTLNFRKLPALWVLVTLPAPLPVRATFDMMLRPAGVEAFSAFASLPDQIEPPAGFPLDCAIRTDDPAGLPAETVLRRHLALFASERVKELVISPKGLRIVWLAEEARRGPYLFFRDAEMGCDPLPAETLRPLLEALLALRADILAEARRSVRMTA